MGQEKPKKHFRRSGDMESGLERAPSWQTLPCEIRYLIYEFVLISYNTPPSMPDEAGERREIYCDIGTEDRHRSFFCVSDPPRSASSALLRSCRQTNIELSNLIASKHVLDSKSLFSHHLDCMVQHFQVWPTWVRLPYAGRYLPNLEVDLRIFRNRRATWG